MPRFFVVAFAVVIGLLAVTHVAASSPTIDSKTLYECTETAYSYSCPNTPCTIVARPSDDATQTLSDIGTVSSENGTVSWECDVTEGTDVVVYITDAEGNVGNNAAETVNEGTSTTCLNSTSSSSSTTGSSASSSTGDSSLSGTATSSSSSSSSTSSSTSAALTLQIARGLVVATVLGAAILVI
ncbi:hypothetical protein JCM1840_007420 [Sporobolomyces johnsonii]